MHRDKYPFPWSVAVWCVFVTVAPGLAFSQPASDPATRLPAFGVEETAPRADDVTRLPYAVTRAAREARAIATLMDSFGRAPGVLMQESFGGFEPPRLSIRGSGLQSAPSSRGVTLLLDGFPLGLADGSFNSALVDPQLADRIDIFLGVAGGSYAPAALGGAFSLVTVPELGPPTASLRLEAGSFGAFRALLTGDATRGLATWDGNASFSQQEGFREHSAQERAAFFGSVHVPMPGGPETTVSVYHSRPVYDVPGPLTFAAAQADPHSVSADVRRDQPRREADTTQVSAQAMRQTPAFVFKGGLSWLHTDDWFRQLQANGISDSRSDDISLRASVGGRVDLRGAENFVQLTATASRGWRELSRFGNDAGLTGRQFGRDGLYATTANLEIEDIVRLRENIVITAGVAALVARRDISDRLATDLPPANTTEALHSAAIQPHLRLLWAVRPEIAWFAGVSRAVEPPTFDDLLVVGGTYPNLTRHSQALRNQRASTLEIGTAGSHGAVSWDVTAYHGEWSDEILRLADAAGLPRGAVNASPTRHVGLETSASWRILDGAQRLKLVVTAVWSRFYFADDPVYGRNRLAGEPPHQGTAKLSYEHPDGFFTAGILDWTSGDTPVDHAGRMTYPGHVLTHLRAGWRQDQTWSVFVEIRNIFDRPYTASTAGVLDMVRNPAATSIFLPGAGRSFTIGFEGRR